jgi:hypothetical protein
MSQLTAQDLQILEVLLADFGVEGLTVEELNNLSLNFDEEAWRKQVEEDLGLN